MSRSLISLPPVPMASVDVSAFRVTGFVTPIRVKDNRAASVAFHFAAPIYESKNGGKAPRSGMIYGKLTPWTASLTGGRAPRLKPGDYWRDNVP